MSGSSSFFLWAHFSASPAQSCSNGTCSQYDVSAQAISSAPMNSAESRDNQFYSQHGDWNVVRKKDDSSSSQVPSAGTTSRIIHLLSNLTCLRFDRRPSTLKTARTSRPTPSPSPPPRRSSLERPKLCPSNLLRWMMFLTSDSYDGLLESSTSPARVKAAPDHRGPGLLSSAARTPPAPEPPPHDSPMLKTPIL
ncbi:hypothetical protein FB451DRAFT_1376529 [Mycena latifolia]|nr:hypothetical protein FB451DRAFT_1376529 [Mycena latifolia]